MSAATQSNQSSKSRIDERSNLTGFTHTMTLRNIALALALLLFSACRPVGPAGASGTTPTQQGTPTPQMIESYIVSDFRGLNHGNLYTLANGQTWRQTEHWIWIWIWIGPQVQIWMEGGAYRMKVEGIDHPVAVEKIGE